MRSLFLIPDSRSVGVDRWSSYFIGNDRRKRKKRVRGEGDGHERKERVYSLNGKIGIES